MNAGVGFFETLFEKIVNYFFNDFDVKDILVSVVGYIVIKYTAVFFNFIKQKIKKRTNFNISGFWIASFPSFLYEGRNIVELYHIKQKQEELSVKIQHYSDSREEISRLYGKGEIRKNFVALYYSTTKKDSTTLGAMCFKINNSDVEALVLQGNPYEDFSDYPKMKQDAIYKLQKKYILHLRRIDLPWYKRVLFKCNLHPFKSFSEINDFIITKQ